MANEPFKSLSIILKQCRVELPSPHETDTDVQKIPQYKLNSNEFIFKIYKKKN